MKNSQRMLLLGSIVLLQPMAACASEDVLKQKDDWIEVEKPDKPTAPTILKRETSEERGRRIWRQGFLEHDLWRWAQDQKEMSDTYNKSLSEELARSKQCADYWYNIFYVSKESKPIDQD